MTKKLRIAPFAILMTAATAECFGQAQEPCFAFLAKGDVKVACAGATSQITQLGNVDGFAVSNEQAKFVYSTARLSRQVTGSAQLVNTTVLVDLNSNAMKFLSPMKDVLSTCGGLYPIGSATGIYSSARDILSGREVSFQPYIRFRCSSDQKAVVGVVKNLGGDLFGGVPPKTKFAESTRSNVYQFNVSQDGSKIAYYGILGPICVSSSQGPAQCAEYAGTFTDIPAVSNLGEVLVVVGTGRECFYRDSFNFSPALPSDRKEGRDECLGIAYWNPSMKSTKTIEPIGRNPQWLTPATAELLRRLKPDSRNQK